MKKKLLILLSFWASLSFSQTDYSQNWEDFYSYNNVKDFIKVDDLIYAVVDNAVFTYNTVTNKITKMSSVNGLSGETTTSIFYSDTYQKLVIGYESGLIEVIDNQGNITISSDITNFNIAGNKTINHIAAFGSKLYLSTSFGIVEYNIENLTFGDTFFIGAASSNVVVNQTVVFQNNIYAATETGIFVANVNDPFLIDFNNWAHYFSGNFSAILTFNNEVYTSKTTKLYSITSSNTLQTRRFLPSTIKDLKATQDYLTVSLNRRALIFDTSLTLLFDVVADSNSDYFFELNTAFVEDNRVYLATKNFGILQASFSNVQDFTERHPQGPSSNKLFSITAKNNHLWIVYGGYNQSYNVQGKKLGFSHYNNGVWINTPYNPAFRARDLVDITIDPENENKVYLSSYFDGIAVVEDNIITTIWDQTNSGIETSFGVFELVTSTTFDQQGNMWVANPLPEQHLQKRAPNGTWSSFNLSAIMSNNSLGLNEIEVDRSNTVWIGSRRDGILIYNENGDRKRALTTEPTKGSLPHENVRTIAIDKSNRIWIGTKKGMVVYNNASGVFDADIYDANPIIILDDGIPKKLLGDQVINTIEVDGANNKWFGSDNGGVLYTNPSGRETLAIFNKDNSPLPSNTILKIQVDESTGVVYFGTDKGIVAYNSNVAPFSDELEEVYAYPNPVRSNHEFVTIDGRNGTHLPKGTNVKILDASGNLVFETNVVEGQEVNGGKVVWNKRNLAGRKVVSGVYIVLLTANENSETAMTKIAIIN